MPTISIETDYDLTDEDMEEILKNLDDDDIGGLLNSLNYDKSFKFGAQLLNECASAGPSNFAINPEAWADIFEYMQHEKFDRIVNVVCDNEGEPLERMLLLSLLQRQHSANPEMVTSIQQLLRDLFRQVDEVPF